MKSLSLSRKLKLGIIILAIIGLIGAFLFVNTLVRNMVYDSILENTIRGRMIQAQQVDAWFQEANNIVETLAETLPLVNREHYQDIVIHFLNQYDFVQSVWIALEDGGFYDSALWVPPHEFVIQERPWWRVSEARSGEAAITLPYISVETNAIVTTFSRHVRNWNGQEGVIAMNIEMQQLEVMMNYFQLDAEGYLLLIGPSGEIIFHPNRGYMPSHDYGLQYMPNILGYTRVFDRFVSGYNVVDYMSRYGVPSYFIQFPLLSTGWTFVSVIPRTVASIPVRQTLSGVMATIIALLSMMVVFSIQSMLREISIFQKKEYQQKHEERAQELTMKLHEQKINERIQLIMDAGPVCITWYDASRTMIGCNEEAVKLFSIDTKESLVKAFNENFYDFFPPHQPCGTTTKVKIAMLFHEVEISGNSRFEFIHLDANGEELPTDTNLVRIDYDDTYIFVAYLLDLRETKAAEKKSREERDLIEALYEASPMFIDVWDEEYNLIECNDKVCDLLGVADKWEFINNLNEKYNPLYQPCGTLSMELYKKKLKIGLDKGYIKFDWTHIDVNGNEVPLEITYVRLIRQGKRLMVGYNYDLREIRRLEQKRLEAVEESNHAKSSFLARMSHEIRTPIAAVLGLSEIQLRKHEMPPHTEEVFVKIYDSSKTLLNIVNDILDFSKIESGKMPVIDSEYSVASLISDAAQLHLVYLERKGVSFQMHVDEKLPANLIGDVLRIKQIINNLLTNAFKYTDYGTVTLSLHCEQEKDGYVTLVASIQDTGMGMTALQIDEIKGEYVRLHEHEKTFVNGTGLGLPIVYSLAQMMDAQIDIKSEANKGTVATVRIPQKVSGAKTLGLEMAKSLQNFESSTWSVPKELAFKAESMPYGKVLVVDDVETNLHVAEAMLESFDLNIELCESGKDAIGKIKQGKVYDIIFMDHMMPGIDGIEATKILRDMGYDSPIIALTANAVKGQAEMFMNSGFSGFISKPIDIKLLYSYLLRFIKNKHEL